MKDKYPILAKLINNSSIDPWHGLQTVVGHGEDINFLAQQPQQTSSHCWNHSGGAPKKTKKAKNLLIL